MQGHIRRRDAGSWEYTIDIGRAGATLPEVRQEVLGRAATEGGLPALRRRAHPRRRAPPRDQGRLRHQTRGPGGDEQGRGRRRGAGPRGKLAPHRARVPHQGVAAGDRAHHPPDHLSTPTWPTSSATSCPALGSVQLQKLAPAQINALYAKLARSGRRNGKASHRAHGAPRPRRAAPRAQGRRALGLPGAQPGRPRRPAARRKPRKELRTWSAEQLGAFLASQRDDRLYAPLAHCWP